MEMSPYVSMPNWAAGHWNTNEALGLCSESNDPLFFIQPISPLYCDIAVDTPGRVGRIFQI